MVVKGKKLPSKPEVIFKKPTSVEDLKNAPEDKFIIKFSNNSCWPCKQMVKWLLNEFKPIGHVPIYSIILDTDEFQQKPLVSTMFNIYGVPLLVVTNRSLSVIDKLEGFKAEKVAEFINKHFDH